MIERGWFLEDGTPTCLQVSEVIEVYDGPTALALSHLLNHLKLLTTVASVGLCSEAEKQLLARHAQYGVGDDPFEEADVLGVLEQECLALVRHLVEVATARQLRRQTALIEQMRARIPYLDYRYELEG
jgi:hypothetical protein